MRVAAFTELSGPDGVSILERDAPVAGDDEAVVAVEACSLNHHDLWILEGDGSVSAADLPFVSGLDVAGVVESAGDDAAVDPGDRVLLCPNQTCGHCRFCRDGPENLCVDYDLFHGGLAERIAVPADRLVALPDGVDFRSAAPLPTAYVTAWHMLRRAAVDAGDLVFVPGATGGVGVAAVQLLDVLGARSIGTSASASKLETLDDLGADHVVEGADPEELREAVAEIGEPDAVLNHLGGPFTRLGMDLMRRGGRMVVCGRTVGSTSEVDVADTFWQHKRLVGSTMGTQADLERLVTLVADGAFDPLVDAVYPLEDTAQAFARMQKRHVLGNVVVTP